ncbi:MAG: 2-phosphoglycolate phosphatase [Halieaceae bacterium]|jgi:2-phosphoglycolate phosphatase
MMPKTCIEAVLFDLDGTLLDTAADFIEVLRQLRAEHMLAALPDHEVRGQVSNGARALVTLALGLVEGDPTFEENRLRLLEIYEQVLGSLTKPFPGIRELLVELQRRDVKWGIVTNKPSYLTLPLLAKVQLQPPTGSVVCPDHVVKTKPDPEPMYLACEQLDCSPEKTIYVGDHRRDIDAGRAAGMITVAAGYGYLAEGDDIHSWSADTIVATSETLLDAINLICEQIGSASHD